MELFESGSRPAAMDTSGSDHAATPADSKPRKPRILKRKKSDAKDSKSNATGSMALVPAEPPMEPMQSELTHLNSMKDRLDAVLASFPERIHETTPAIRKKLPKMKLLQRLLEIQSLPLCHKRASH